MVILLEVEKGCHILLFSKRTTKFKKGFWSPTLEPVIYNWETVALYSDAKIRKQQDI